MSIFKSILLAGFACSIISLASAQTFWSQYGKNAQHTAESTNGVQALNSILWQTPVDLFPVGDTNGEDVLAHYGSPLMTSQTLVLPVRTGPNNNYPSTNDTYRVEGHNLGTGVTVWTQSTDFVDWMPHDWTPSYGCAIDSNGKVYYAGAAGTVYQRSNADSATATVTQLCFYGLANYQANKSAYQSNVQICTPISVDANNNVYFGFYVTGGWSNSLGLASGIAKITAAGIGTWVTSDSASGTSASGVATNCAPAVTTDGNYVYVAIKQQGGYGNPMILRLNTSNLTTASKVSLPNIVDLGGTQHFPYILDDGTASPMIGPDGDVYYGVWGDDLESRGWMLHYSGDLSTAKTMGGFGWDDTASVVPASAVPSYKGSSSYLILSKYNNYSDAGLYPAPGNGLNEVAVLDPNATEDYTVQYESGDGTGPTYLVMKEILTVVGVTANTGQPGVREWCINMAAIDAAGKGAIVNSEDGHCYRWDFTTNSLTQVQNLQPATGEAYTPTVVSADGIAFAINNAELFAMWDGVKPSSLSIAKTMAPSSSTSASLTLSGNATGPGATVQLSSNNAYVQVPATAVVPSGSKSVTFNLASSSVTTEQTAVITATRYGYTTTTSISVVPLALSQFSVNENTAYMSYAVTGTVTFNENVGSNTTVTAKSLDTYCSVTQPTVAAGHSSATFTISTSALPSTTPHVTTIQVTYGTQSFTQSITIEPILITSFTAAPTSIRYGGSTTLTIMTSMNAGATSIPVLLSCPSGIITVPSYGYVLPGTNTVSVVASTASAKVGLGTTTVNVNATLCGKVSTVTATLVGLRP